MRAHRLLLCMALAGCASASPRLGETSVPQQTPTRIEGLGGTTELRTTGSDPRAAFAIAASPDRVFGALTVAYQELGLTASTVNTQAGIIGVEGARIRRSLGRTRLSTYLSCGERMGAQVADTDDVFLTLQTQAAPGEGGGTTLRTVVQATARATSSSSALINCATTGALEARIVELVRKHTS